MSLKPPDGATLPRSSKVDVLFESPINVQYPEYGAKGDGSTNDTAAINRALAAGDVFIPPGTYNVSTPLLVPSARLVYGAGANSVIRCTGNQDAINNADQTGGNTDIRIRDLHVIGTQGSGSPYQKGVYLKTVTDSLVDGVTVENTYLQGIQVDRAVRVRIAFNAVRAITHGNGVSVDDLSQDVVITGNTIADVYDSAVGLHNGSVRTVVQGNTITYGVTSNGHGVDVYGAPETVIQANTIKGATSHGVYVHTSGSNVPSRCVINANVILGVTGDGVQIFAAADDTLHDTAITNNVIFAPSNDGVYIGNGVARGVIHGNVINAAGGNGIELIQGTGGVPYRLGITGNYARGCTGWGVLASSSVSDCLIVANHVGGNTAGAISAPGGNTQANNFTT